MNCKLTLTLTEKNCYGLSLSISLLLTAFYLCLGHFGIGIGIVCNCSRDLKFPSEFCWLAVDYFTNV